MDIPAHVTLLGPFMPVERIDETVRAQLRALFARHEPIDISLTSVRRFPGVLYLGLEPDAACRALADDLAAAFPEFPPYGGRFEHVVHHVTSRATSMTRPTAPSSASWRPDCRSAPGSTRRISSPSTPMPTSGRCAASRASFPRRASSRRCRWARRRE